MPELPVGEVSEIHKLLLDPSAANVLEVTSRLEPLAQEVARLRLHLQSGGAADAAKLAFLLTVSNETQRVRSLLDNAARFYNALNVKTEAAGYGRNGLLRAVQSPRRALAQL